MFGLGIGEVIFVLVIALLVLGPEKLPKLAKTLGKGMREFRRAASEFQQGFSEIEQETNRTLNETQKIESGKEQESTKPPETVSREATPSDKPPTVD